MVDSDARLLPSYDSAIGRHALTMQVIAAGAEFERDQLIERTQAGLARAKAQGVRMGRAMLLSPAQQDEIVAKRDAGVSLGALAEEYGVDRSAVQRVEKRRAAAKASILAAQYR